MTKCRYLRYFCPKNSLEMQHSYLELMFSIICSLQTLNSWLISKCRLVCRKLFSWKVHSCGIHSSEDMIYILKLKAIISILNCSCYEIETFATNFSSKTENEIYFFILGQDFQLCFAHIPPQLCIIQQESGYSKSLDGPRLLFCKNQKKFSAP